MFVVKHANDKGARFWMTTEVHYRTDPSTAPTIEAVQFTTIDGNWVELESGSIFVMNEAGKTIDQYHFYPDAAYKKDAA